MILQGPASGLGPPPPGAACPVAPRRTAAGAHTCCRRLPVQGGAVVLGADRVQLQGAAGARLHSPQARLLRRSTRPPRTSAAQGQPSLIGGYFMAHATRVSVSHLEFASAEGHAA